MKKITPILVTRKRIRDVLKEPRIHLSGLYVFFSRILSGNKLLYPIIYIYIYI